MRRARAPCTSAVSWRSPSAATARRPCSSRRPATRRAASPPWPPWTSRSSRSAWTEGPTPRRGWPMRSCAGTPRSAGTTRAGRSWPRPSASPIPATTSRDGSSSTTALFDLHSAAEALDLDARVPVAHHEGAAVARAVGPGAGAARVVRERGDELGADAAAEALDVEAGGGVLGQAQPDATAVAPGLDARSLRQGGVELDLARHGPEHCALDLLALHADPAAHGLCLDLAAHAPELDLSVERLGHHLAMVALELDPGVHGLELGPPGSPLDLDLAVRRAQDELSFHALGLDPPVHDPGRDAALPRHLHLEIGLRAASPGKPARRPRAKRHPPARSLDLDPALRAHAHLVRVDPL